MVRPCQDCGRPARYKQPHQKGAKQRSRKVKAREDHDLCFRCWKRRIDAVGAEELEEAEYGEG